MRFVNDSPGSVTSQDLATAQELLRDFETKDEVRVAEGARFLAPILNALTVHRRKFYLVHLPDGGGWVLRRHRPTGAFHGKPADTEVTANVADGDSPPADAPPTGEFAEEYFRAGDHPRAGDAGSAPPAAQQ